MPTCDGMDGGRRQQTWVCPALPSGNSSNGTPWGGCSVPSAILNSVGGSIATLEAATLEIIVCIGSVSSWAMPSRDFPARRDLLVADIHDLPRYRNSRQTRL